ncbi:type VI secretion system baseplate subunit TssF [Pseudoduganella sp. LjRoot289]|uniref:type VI secretion system baseplate subunit TssF n=1 Tax=Pseudoduganella sp. LjRoot289 TaxID=3342314 RepID=UPI003ED059FC
MEDLLPYYERELILLRRYGSEFAERFPKIAGELRMGGDGSADPQVERIIQGLALLAARIVKRLEDDYSKFTESLLEALFPHYLRPFPSCAIARAGSVVPGAPWRLIPRGTELNSAPVQGVQCKFRSCYDIAAGPLRLTEAGVDAMVNAPANVQLPAGASAVLRLRFEGAGCGSMPPQALRIFIDGEPSFCAALRDALFLRIVKAYVETDGGWSAMPAIPVAPVGFEEDDALIPFGSRSQPAYRLLTEYFAYPEKFNFFQLDAAALGVHLSAGCERFTLHLVLGDAMAAPQAARMLNSLSAANLLLGCAPVVNLFSKPGEPIAITQRAADYAVVASAEHASAYEVYSIDSVTMLSQTGKAGTVTEFRPFYCLRHGEGGAQQGHYWVLRHDATLAVTSPGHEKRLSLIDADMAPLEFEQDTLSLALTCTNRDLPTQLRDSLRAGELTNPQGAGDVAICFARRPSQPCRFDPGPGLQWRLISHLALNHHGLAPEGLAAFREMLTLYDLRQSAVSRRQIGGVAGLEHVPATRWMRCVRGASLVHGMEVRMTLDEDAFVGSGTHLFVQVVDQFLAMHVQVNSYIELVVLAKQSGKELVRCKARNGQAALM